MCIRDRRRRRPLRPTTRMMQRVRWVWRPRWWSGAVAPSRLSRRSRSQARAGGHEADLMHR
eukprot:4308817-Prymnesium_polylepis.1